MIRYETRIKIKWQMKLKSKEENIEPKSKASNFKRKSEISSLHGENSQLKGAT
jgi:hypothetical protein